MRRLRWIGLVLLAVVGGVVAWEPSRVGVQTAILLRLSRLGALGSVTFPDLLDEEEGDHEITAEVGSFTYRYGSRVSTRWNSALTPKIERGQMFPTLPASSTRPIPASCDTLKSISKCVFFNCSPATPKNRSPGSCSLSALTSWAP